MFIWGVLAVLTPCSAVIDSPEMLNLFPPSPAVGVRADEITQIFHLVVF